MKKKWVLLFVVALLVDVLIFATLIVIIIKQHKDIKEINNQISFIKKEVGIVEVDTTKVMSKDEFTKHIEKVELTKDNWKDYFEIKENVTDQKNSWGDVISKDKSYIFKLKDSYYDTGELIDTAMEYSINKNYIKNKEEWDFLYGNIKTFTFAFFSNFSDSYTEKKQSVFTGIKQLVFTEGDRVINLDIDGIKCKKIKGTLYYLKDFPEENWQTDNLNRKYVNVDGKIYYKNISGKKDSEIFLKDFID